MTSKIRLSVYRSLTAVALFALAACGSGQKPEPPKVPEAPKEPMPAATPALVSPDSAALAARAPDLFKVLFETTKGNFTVTAHRDWAPRGVDRFHYLVSNGYFDGASFFRVMPGFIVQFGISGNPEISAAWRERRFPDDPVKKKNTRGILVYATAGPNTRTTQLFINLGDNPSLDPQGFAGFAEVTEGMAVVDSIFPTGDGTVDQGGLQMQGNEYLKAFPQVDRIKTARIVPAAGKNE